MKTLNQQGLLYASLIQLGDDLAAKQGGKHTSRHRENAAKIIAGRIQMYVNKHGATKA